MALDKDNFNPNDVCVDNGNYFGLPFSVDEARLVLMSVPWDVTTSYGGGASFAPDAIISASYQLDFYDKFAPDAWREGVATLPVDYSIQDRSARLRGDAKKVIECLESGGLKINELLVPKRLERVNQGSAQLNDKVYNESVKWLEQGKIIGLVGGDHSVPLGLIKAVAERNEEIGVLHLDAHCDLREAYEGFKYSHASIMYNVLQEAPNVSKIVQVGVRDFCDDEVALANSTERVEMFDDYTLMENKFRGTTWHEQCMQIVERLPKNVYISFDIDALDPSNSPSTGTPVPGGLSFNESIYLIKCVVDSGRRIVGFDLCEVSPHVKRQWDANVGARVLFKLCGMIIKSN